MINLFSLLSKNYWVLERIFLGVALAAPMGPVSIEMIRQGLQSGFLASFSTCCGGAIGDAICLLIAHLGLLRIAQNKRGLSMIGFLGAFFLIYLGIQNCLFEIKLNDVLNTEYPHSLPMNLFIGCSLAIINPISILFWIGLYANINDALHKNKLMPSMLIIVGVLLWGILLSIFLSISKNTLSPNALSYLVWFSSILLIGYGLKFAYHSFNTITHCHA